MRIGPLDPRRLTRTASLALALGFLPACASAGHGGGARDPDFIRRDEIVAAQAAGARDAFEIVERLRPRWLQLRGELSINLETMIVVYQNDNPLGGPSTLRQMPAELIESIRSLDSALAGQLPGLGSRHVERAIVVRLRGQDG